MRKYDYNRISQNALKRFFIISTFLVVFFFFLTKACIMVRNLSEVTILVNSSMLS